MDFGVLPRTWRGTLLRTAVAAGKCQTRTSAGEKKGPGIVPGPWAGNAGPVYMFRTIASPNSEHLTSVAPSIRRAKS
jgi:hypothetical protein